MSTEYVTTADIAPAVELWGAPEIASLIDYDEEFVKLLVIPRLDFPKPLLSAKRGRHPKRRWAHHAVRQWYDGGGRDSLIRIYGRRIVEPLQTRPLFDDLPAGGRAPVVLSKDRDPMAHFLRSAIRQARKRATKLHRQIDITLEMMSQMLSQQGAKCAVSKVPFSLEKLGGSAVRPFAPSIDRINSAQGYVDGNVRLVCHCVNLMMNEWGDTVYHVFMEKVRK